MKRSWERLAWLTLVVVVLCVAVIQAAGGATNSSKVVKAAYNARTGQLRILTKSAPKVRKGEKSITWNKAGVAGPVGPAGPTGATGPAGPIGTPGILIPGPNGIADVGPPEFQRAISAGFTLLDVRTAAEYESGHIPGALNISITDLPAAIPELGTAKPIAVYCGSGKRSAQATVLLKAAGCTSIVNLASGLSVWTAAGGRTVTGPGQGTW